MPLFLVLKVQLIGFAVIMIFINIVDVWTPLGKTRSEIKEICTKKWWQQIVHQRIKIPKSFAMLFLQFAITLHLKQI